MSGSSTMQGSKKQLHCTYCDGTTHIVERCFYLIGFPTGHALHGKNVQPRNGAQKVAANQTGIGSFQTNIKSVQTSDQPFQFILKNFHKSKVSFKPKNPLCQQIIQVLQLLFAHHPRLKILRLYNGSLTVVPLTI